MLYPWRHFTEISRRLWPLQSGALCSQARRRTDLDDFGDPPIEPALSVLLNSLQHEANLHPLGRFLMRCHLRALLESRLRLTEAWRGQLQAEASPIRHPVFITGMPRSGSTFLHELLAEDPDHRAPRVWEVMFPLPARTGQKSDRDRRIKKAAQCLWWFRRLAPRADSVHPLRACTPQECIAIHSYTFLSQEFLSTGHVPSYEAFLDSADLGPAYAWQKRFLQYLQLPAPDKRWVLKSPDHVYGLSSLFSTFPDAVIIQTHRNPLDVLPSSTQLVEVLHGLFARSVDRVRIRIRETRILAQAMQRFTQFRDAHPGLAERFIDVRYTELISDPLAVIRRIYRHLDRPLAQAAVDRMQRLAANRSRYRRRSPAKTLADERLNFAEEARLFEGYCLRFGISCPQPSLVRRYS